MIIIEGPDRSGKSTLAQALAARLRRTIQRSEGPPRYNGDILERIERYIRLRDDVIFDRFPTVSHVIYSVMRGQPHGLTAGTFNDVQAFKPLYIYCDPGTTELSTKYKPSEVESPEHVDMLRRKYALSVSLYRHWAINHAHIIRRWGEPIERIVAMALQGEGQT